MKKIISNRLSMLCVLAFALLSASCKKDTPILPETETEFSICKQIHQLENNKAFIEKLTSLWENAKQEDYETGYILYPSKTLAFRYEYIQGESNKASLIFDPNGQIDGFMHGHYGGLYPNFSGSDIRAIYQSYTHEKINNAEAFISTVVSATGDAYLLKIENLSAFVSFSKKHFETEADFRRFESNYISKQKNYFNSRGLVSSYEYALYETLENAGLVIFKSVTPFNTWLKISKDQAGNPITSPCH